jgi:hypothetical protein
MPNEASPKRQTLSLTALRVKSEAKSRLHTRSPKKRGSGEYANPNKWREPLPMNLLCLI